jgi:hypothetical protein
MENLALRSFQISQVVSQVSEWRPLRFRVDLPINMFHQLESPSIGLGVLWMPIHSLRVAQRRMVNLQLMKRWSTVLVVCLQRGQRSQLGQPPSIFVDFVQTTNIEWMEYLNTNLAHELDGDLFGKNLYMQTLQMPFLDFFI